MKPQKLAIVLCLLICGKSVFAQTNNTERLIFPFLYPEGQSNIIITADLDHPKPCAPEYTNLISNTNLILPSELNRLREVTRKYKNVSSNSGPAGSVFERWGLRYWKYVDLNGITNVFRVACFAYDNCDAKDEIYEQIPKCIIAKFRTRPGDGYDAYVVTNSLIMYQEYKGGVLDGLFVMVHDPYSPNDADQHIGMWARFVKGKIQGKFIAWHMNEHDGGQAGFKIVAEAEFRQPFDFLKYQSIPIDYAWTDAPPSNPQHPLN
jgi:hypothetical protein